MDKNYFFNSKKINKFCLFLLLIIFSNLKSYQKSYDKWIIVTSIQKPTSQLKKLANINGWHLLVIGDKKTPKDWNLENCEYLSVEKQLSLGYELTKLLPYNHYARKNIGYLYAIENGAEIIYDTDDDNEPICEFALNPLPQKTALPKIESDYSSINIYAYFGRPDVWPRGYPLENLKDSKKFNLLEPKEVEIGIEQGLVNGDPDVDAIFRLTQYGQIDIKFENKASCALKEENYCPFNSQNTFFHKKAFHALYIPSSVSMRVSDIWRGYYATKLINLSGLSLVFSQASAFQERNSHNLLNDFKQEDDLYKKSGQLISFLKNWDPRKAKNFNFHLFGYDVTNYFNNNSFFESKFLNTEEKLYLMEILFQDLTENKFFGESEMALCKAWINDLKKVLK